MLKDAIRGAITPALLMNLTSFVIAKKVCRLRQSTVSGVGQVSDLLKAGRRPALPHEHGKSIIFHAKELPNGTTATAAFLKIG